MRSGDFEAVLSYNTEKIKSLTADELSYIRFSNVLPAPFEFVSYNPDTGVLTLTIRNDGTSIAGQSFKFDVGYKAGLSEYNESDHDMNKGELELVFGEPTPQIRKRVLYKSDAANRSRFIVGEDKTTVVDATYTKEGTSISSDPSPIPELRIDDGYAQKGWYMLSSTGRPVKDNAGNIVMFADEEAIKAYIYGDSAPSGVTFADEFADFAHPDKIMGFTFQANVEEIKQRPVTARVILDTKDALNESGILGIKNAGRVSGKITGVTSSTITAFKEGNEEGWNSCDDNHRLTYDSQKNSSRVTALDSTYPDYVRFYAIGTEVYWYTVDRNTYEPTNGTVYLEQNSNTYSNTPNLFGYKNGSVKYTNLIDVSGMYDWDLSGMNMFGYMFANTAITEFKLNRTIKKSGYMYLSRMFYNCGSLTSVKMSIDTSEAPFKEEWTDGNGYTYVSAQTKEMFLGCGNLVELNLSGDFSNVYNAIDMFNGCTSLTKEEFRRAFSTWKWNPSQIMQTNKEGDKIFKNNNNLSGKFNDVDLVDSEGNHYTGDGDKIKFVRLAD